MSNLAPSAPGGGRVPARTSAHRWGGKKLRKKAGSTSPVCAVAGEQPQTYHCGSWPCLCLPGRYGSSLFLLVVIPSGFGFGGSIPVIPARLAQGFACHPINLRLSQEAYAVRGTCHRHPHEFHKPIIAVVSVFALGLCQIAIFASTHHHDSGWSHRWLENDCCSGGSK